MRVQLTKLATVVAVLATIAACNHTARPGRDDNGPVPESRLRVENQAFLDMTVYIISNGGGRQRLGTVTGNTSQTFVIPKYIIGPANQVSILCEPIGSNRASISNSISVQPGQTVTLTIPPTAG
ncbi:MAG: hypothetical protein M3Y05_11430 [Gemmatimonadota bacterium]|nr:hypothetical protein [Gemmatimonadota bacterium]